MADSEVEEVSSSTDAVIPPCTSNEDFLSSGHGEALVEAVSSITGSEINPVVLATQSQLATSNPGNQVTPSSLQALTSTTNHVTINSDGQLSVVTSGPDQMYPNSSQIVLTAPGPTIQPAGISTVSLDNSTLQGLLANQGTVAQLATTNGETIQIIAVSNPSDISNSGKVWQVLPAVAGGADLATFIAVNQQELAEDEDAGQVLEQIDSADNTVSSGTQVVDMVPVSTVPDLSVSNLISPCSVQLPPGCPAWAARLKDCENIGDSYRGWVESEVELDLLLTFHKQQTQSFWGTRQSPSPAKQSTRLMWKSQYVPFDGIPFVNSGSRAVVMECQYGPRRKGSQAKRQVDGTERPIKEFKQTCPARIYIKKVRKYPEFAVDVNMDKKSLKLAMDRAFEMLKKKGTGGWGQERFYVQLPTEKAHEFHSESSEGGTVASAPCRLHPRVAQQIREIVAGGELRLYAVRKALRRFVEKELFKSADAVPEKHNLTYYPTVNDLQNHIHQAIQDISSGSLPVQTVSVEVMNGADSNSGDLAPDPLQQTLSWSNTGQNDAQAETVTVTLTQNPGEDGQHVISRVETHMSDGSTQVTSSLTPETAQLLSKLHPNMFPAGSLLQLQQQNLLNATPSTSASHSEHPVTISDATTSAIMEQTQQTESMSTMTESDMLGAQDEDIGSINETGADSHQAAVELMGQDVSQSLAPAGMATLQIVQAEGEDGQIHVQAVESAGESTLGGRLVTVAMGPDGCLTLLDGTPLTHVTSDIASLDQVKMEEDEDT